MDYSTVGKGEILLTDVLNKTILIINNNQFKTRNIKTLLQNCGYKVKTVDDGSQAIYYLEKNVVHILIADYDTKEISGVALIRKALSLSPFLSIIFISALSNVRNIVEAIKFGAFDYLDCNFTFEELLRTIEKAIEDEELGEINTFPNDNYQHDGMIFKSENMKVITSIIDRVAMSNATVLLLGKSGVGKEVIAKMIHERSARKDKRFVIVNCAAIPENLIESELFGHEKGSFTGASSRKIGKFEQAEGGTIFLDELAELSLEMQVKFLRVLQEKQLERLGASNSINVDVRIIAATNKDLAKELEKGTFREDLYYRINVIKIYIPPLNERKEDIIPMANAFLNEFSKEYDKNLNLIDIDAMHILLNNEWKGNVRELKNVIERAVVIANKDEKILTRNHLPIEINNDTSFIQYMGKTEITLREYEKLIITDTLNKLNGNKTEVAKILGIKRQTLYNKIKEYNITS